MLFFYTLWAEDGCLPFYNFGDADTEKLRPLPELQGVVGATDPCFKLGSVKLITSGRRRLKGDTTANHARDGVERGWR